MTGDVFGFIGLGNMGQPMARNIISAGLSLIVHDTAGTMERSPNGAVLAQPNQEVARKANVIVLSLPNLESNRSVVHEIATVGHVGSIVVDTCTIGPEAAAENNEILKSVGVTYLDSPVSGLKFRAEEGALVSMIAGNVDALECPGL